MFAVLLSHLKYLRDAFFSSDSPRQLAAGVTLGLFIGLIPKGNLLSIGLSVAMFATMVNLGVGMITAIIASFVAQFTDPIASGIGNTILTQPQLAVIWQWFATMPVVPWTRFNNTVVMGNLALACLLAVPTYRWSWWRFDKKLKANADLARQSESPATEVNEQPESANERALILESLSGEPANEDEQQPVELPKPPPSDIPEFEKTTAAESKNDDLESSGVADTADESVMDGPTVQPQQSEIDIDLPTVAGDKRTDAAHQSVPPPKARPRRRRQKAPVRSVGAPLSPKSNKLSIPSFDILSSPSNRDEHSGDDQRQD